ncbi:aldo/keto reductase [Nakamurella silvestris]|nr:aldo/keto reductase [Nakamurella silvestris]
MEMRRVGRSGLQVSRLGLGTMTWGRDTDADEAAGQLEAFVAAGGTLIDTANVYGDGDAESIIGTLVPDVIPRSAVTLATTTVGAGSGRGGLLGALDESITRLGGYVDLWQVHGWDELTPFEETCSALVAAVNTGRTRYVGVSGYSGWQLATMAAWLRHEGITLTSTEAEYSLVEREPEQSLIPAATAHGVGLLAWAPLGRGVLTGKYRHGTPADSRGASPHFSRYVARHRNESSSRIVEAVATAADGLGTSPLAVACAWARDRPGVVSAIVGARDSAQLLGALAAEEITLPTEIVQALQDVSDADGPDEN